jgi:hypothetical protein
MSKRDRRILLVILIVFVVVAAAAAGVVWYERREGHVSRTNVARIRKGMDLAEATRILGGNGKPAPVEPGQATAHSLSCPPGAVRFEWRTGKYSATTCINDGRIAGDVVFAMTGEPTFWDDVRKAFGL